VDTPYQREHLPRSLNGHLPIADKYFNAWESRHLTVPPARIELFQLVKHLQLGVSKVRHMWHVAKGFHPERDVANGGRTDKTL